MNTDRMPDTEALVIDALRFHMADDEIGVVVEIPHDWNKLMPVAVVNKVEGSTPDPRFVDRSNMSVHVIAPNRKQASDLARKAQASLHRAAVDGFQTAEGVITKMETIKGPVPVWDGLTGKHSGSRSFDATYEIWARRHYAT